MEFKAFQILAAAERRHFHFKPEGTEMENSAIRDRGQLVETRTTVGLGLLEAEMVKKTQSQLEKAKTEMWEKMPWLLPSALQIYASISH